MSADESTLYIATETNASDVLKRMIKDLGLPIHINQRPSNMRFYPQPYYECVTTVQNTDSPINREISVSAVDYLLGRPSLLPDLFRMAGIPQLAHHVEVDFQILSGDYFGESYYEIIRMVSAILRRVEGDCILATTGHFIPGLIRKNGQVIIDPSIWEWPEKARQALSVPFTIDNLPHAPNGL